MFKPMIAVCLLILLGASITPAQPSAASIRECDYHGRPYRCNCSIEGCPAVDPGDNARNCCWREFGTPDKGIRILEVKGKGRNPPGIELGLEHLFLKGRLGFEFAAAYEGDDDVGGPQYLGTVGLNLHFNRDFWMYEDEKLDLRVGGFLAYVWPYDVRCDLLGVDRPSICAPGNFDRTEIGNKPAWGVRGDLGYWIGRRWGLSFGVQYLRRRGGDENLVVLDRNLLYGTVGVVWRLPPRRTGRPVPDPGTEEEVVVPESG